MATNEKAADLLNRLIGEAEPRLPEGERKAWQADWDAIVHEIIRVGYIPEHVADTLRGLLEKAADRRSGLLEKASSEQSGLRAEHEVLRVNEAEECIRRAAQS